MLIRCTLVFGLLALGCSAPTTIADRMETVVDTFNGQLDRSSSELGALQEEIDQARLSDGDRFRLNLTTADIRSRILEVQFDMALAQMVFDMHKMERIGDEIVSIFTDTSALRLQLIIASSD